MQVVHIDTTGLKANVTTQSFKYRNSPRPEVAFLRTSSELFCTFSAARACFKERLSSVKCQCVKCFINTGSSSSRHCLPVPSPDCDWSIESLQVTEFPTATNTSSQHKRPQLFPPPGRSPAGNSTSSSASAGHELQLILS
jgi:hypothetical protein